MHSGSENHSCCVICNKYNRHKRYIVKTCLISRVTALRLSSVIFVAPYTADAITHFIQENFRALGSQYMFGLCRVLVHDVSQPEPAASEKANIHGILYAWEWEHGGGFAVAIMRCSPADCSSAS